MRKYAVYLIRIGPTTDCRDADPFKYYVGSTYVDDDVGIDRRIQQHKSGEKSSLLKAGYRIGQWRQEGPLYDAREDAEAAEAAVADALRRMGHRTWQR